MARCDRNDFDLAEFELSVDERVHRCELQRVTLPHEGRRLGSNRAQQQMRIKAVVKAAARPWHRRPLNLFPSKPVLSRRWTRAEVNTSTLKLHTSASPTLEPRGRSDTIRPNGRVGHREIGPPGRPGGGVPSRVLLLADDAGLETLIDAARTRGTLALAAI
jgi:hypothetical protein